MAVLDPDGDPDDPQIQSIVPKTISDLRYIPVKSIHDLMSYSPKTSVSILVVLDLTNDLDGPLSNRLFPSQFLTSPEILLQIHPSDIGLFC